MLPSLATFGVRGFILANGDVSFVAYAAIETTNACFPNRARSPFVV
jgi:hypothetical protein